MTYKKKAYWSCYALEMILGWRIWEPYIFLVILKIETININCVLLEIVGSGLVWEFLKSSDIEGFLAFFICEKTGCPQIIQHKVL